MALQVFEIREELLASIYLPGSECSSLISVATKDVRNLDEAAPFELNDRVAERSRCRLLDRTERQPLLCF